MSKQELLERIERAQAEIEAAKKLLEDYKQKKVREPENGEIYYYIDAGDIEHCVWDGFLNDRELYEMGEVFLEFEDAKREIKRRKTHHKLKELASKLNTEPINLDDSDQKKWCLNYHAIDKRVRMVNMCVSCEANQAYFTDNFLDEILKVIPKEDLIEYCRGDY